MTSFTERGTASRLASVAQAIADGNVSQDLLDTFAALHRAHRERHGFYSACAVAGLPTHRLTYPTERTTR